jgi:hypothetical protein
MVIPKILLWDGPGVYVPLVLDEQVEWWKNEDGKPEMGVQVDSLDNAKRFATVKRLKSYFLTFEE